MVRARRLHLVAIETHERGPNYNWRDTFHRLSDGHDQNFCRSKRSTATNCASDQDGTAFSKIAAQLCGICFDDDIAPSAKILDVCKSTAR